MVLADTGYWVALFSKRDPFHALARRCSLRYGSEGLITTQAVIGESCYLLARWDHPERAMQFLDILVDQDVALFDLSVIALRRAASLMRKYRDLPMDYADASLVLLAEHLGHGRILTTDQRDFGSYRWKNHYPFDNLLNDPTP